MNEKYKELSKNTALFALSSFGTKFLSFMLVPLYTSFLSTKDYGIADLLVTSTTILIVVFTVNISEGVLIFAMDKNYEADEVFCMGIKIFSVGWGIISVVSLVCRLFNIVNCPTGYFVFISIYFAVLALYDILCNYLRAVDCVKEVAIAGVISSFVYILSNIIFLVCVKMGLTGYLIATILGPLFSIIYCGFRIDISLFKGVIKKGNIQLRKPLIRYCFPLVFNSIALWVNSCLDRYFVTGICGVEQNGIYSVANKIPVILSTVYTVFSQAWTMSAVKEFDKEDKDGFFSKTYNVFNSVIIVACSVLIIMNIPIAKLIYANDFFVAWSCSSILLVSIMFNSLTAFIGSIFSANKQSDILAFTTILSAVINTILNIILIPTLGIEGAAVSTAVAHGVMWLIRIRFVKRIIQLRINMFKHLLLYFIIIVQVVAEHTANHGYLFQIIALLMVVSLSGKEFILVWKKIKILIQKRKCSLEEKRIEKT